MRYANKQKRRAGTIWLFLTSLLLTLVAAGCAPGGSEGVVGGGSPADITIERARIDTLFANWETALEQYDVNGMLAPIASDITLSIRENGVPQPDKGYDTLRSELEVNAANQLRMRSQDGYMIDITFELLIAVSPSGTTDVTGTFTTVETIKDVAGTLIHEAGTLDADLVKTGSGWIIRNLILDFNAISP